MPLYLYGYELVIMAHDQDNYLTGRKTRKFIKKQGMVRMELPESCVKICDVCQVTQAMIFLKVGVLYALIQIRKFSIIYFLFLIYLLLLKIFRCTFKGALASVRRGLYCK